MLIRGIAATRGHDGGALDQGDIWFNFDGTARHHGQVVNKLFVSPSGEPLEKKIKPLYVGYDFDSLKQRRNCVRPGTAFEQVEIIALIAKEEFKATGKRAEFKGHITGNMISDVLLVNLEDMWMLPAKTKYAVHGKWRTEVGGKTLGFDGKKGGRHT